MPIIFSLILGLLVAPALVLAQVAAADNDFVAYWSAAHLLSRMQNPYSPENLRETRAAALNQPIPADAPPQNVWNPPWLLIALLPVGVLPYSLAHIAWLWLTILMLGISLSLCLQLAGENGDGRIFLWTLVACLFFGPVLSMLKIGQVSGLLLLSLVGSVYLLNKEQDFWAGAVLLLAASKPHITFLALGMVVWWAFLHRRWRFFLGLAGSLGLTLVLFTILLPGWPAAYRGLLTQMHPSDWLSSTWWSFLEVTLRRPVFRWGAFLLTPLIFWLPHKVERLGWLTALNWALLPWLAIAPYGFTFDFVLLLPALVQLIVWLVRRRLTGSAAWGIFAGLVVVNAALLVVLSRPVLPAHWTFWLPSVFLLIYVLANHRLSGANRPLTSLGKG